jgi:hypothetical protein
MKKVKKKKRVILCGNAYFRDTGASTYKCAACVKTSRSQRNAVTPMKFGSLSSYFPNKIVSRERSSILPPGFGSDRYEAVSVQLKTARLNGVCTIDLKNPVGHSS